MKRASDVPPVVDSAGFLPVIVRHRRADQFDERTRLGARTRLRLTVPIRCASEFCLSPQPPARCSISACSDARVCQSLKRMLKRACASAGITLTVLLPTSIEVNSRFDGSK